MNLIFRLLRVFLTSWFKPGLAPTDESSLSFNTLPNDLDIFGHMNNGRYLTLMDLGRLDLILRTGLKGVMVRNRLTPLVGSATIRFRKSLRPFESFRLKSRVVGWNEKWFFIEQRFERKGELVALGMVKGLFRGKGKSFSPSHIMELMGAVGNSPQLPPGIKEWQASEELIFPGHSSGSS